MERVTRFYDNHVDREWNRLADPYHQIEFEVTWHFIERYLSCPSHVIDIGGGPGRYTIRLLESGHRTTLVDLAPASLRKARHEIRRQALDEARVDFVNCDARQLSSIEHDTYDTALLLGPVYHLPEPDDRRRAISEAARVTRPGGYVFTAIINRLCPFRDLLFGDPAAFRDRLAREFDKTMALLQSGVYANTSENPTAFTDAHFATLEEVPSLYAELGLDIVETFSCEGLAAFCHEGVGIVAQDPVAWRHLLDLVIQTCRDPSILGAGEHTVFIGRKRGQGSC